MASWALGVRLNSEKSASQELLVRLTFSQDLARPRCTNCSLRREKRPDTYVYLFLATFNILDEVSFNRPDKSIARATAVHRSH